MSKHVMPSKRKRKPMWLLLVVAALAAGMAIWALAAAIGGGRDAGPDGSATADGQGADVTDPGADMTEDEAAAERQKLLEEANLLARGYFYDEAIAALESAGPLANEEVAAAIADITAQKDALVKYEGQPYHVFFHSLIIYPELAFDDKGHPAEGYNMWMTTVSEFKAMLPLLLENNFVLYDITELTEVVDGVAKPKDIYLPAGKKPLVISIDDVSYYDYMLPDGFATRLVINDKGDVVTEVKNLDGTVTQTYDGDVMPIVDQFVKEHPEFSFRGAKGVVAPTGYQGAFGYRITDPDWFTEEEFKQLCDDVKAIAQRLRETGWQIASHSYTHNSFWRGDMTLSQVQDDLGRWKTLMEPYVGETNILITPFGGRFEDDPAVFDYVVNQMGYTIICPVGAGMSTSYQGAAMLQDRLNLDGYTMLKHPERISKHFFDPTPIVDPARPPLD